ncbi:beta strand repeat-containing protein, partial [Labrys wisconsinensis]
MTFSITDSFVLEQIRIAGLANNWQSTYELVYEALTNPETGERYETVDPAVYIWVEGAKKVNGSEGAFAAYIRDYTARQYEIRNGSPAQDISELIQNASDQIASNFAKQLLYGNTDTSFDALPLSTASLPSLHVVGLNDAAGAASRVFPAATSTGNDNYSPWAGTVLFTNLGDGSFFRDWALTRGTSDFKKESGVYDLIAIAQTVVELKTFERFLQTVMAGEFGTYLAVRDLGDIARTENTDAANVFLKGSYGDDVATAYDIGASIFDDFTGIVQSQWYSVGSVRSDSGSKALTLTSDNAMVHAGAGSDEINADASWSAASARGGLAVIDGGDGSDILSYASFAAYISIYLEAEGAFGYRALVRKSDDAPLGSRDAVYNVEKIIGTDQADKAVLPSNFSKQNLKLDLGAGQNEVTYKASTEAAPPATGHLKINFATTTADGTPVGTTQNTITIDDGIDADNRNAPMLFVDGHQLIGGATFVYDKTDVYRAGDIPNHALFRPQGEYAGYGQDITQADYNTYYAEAVANMFKNAGALSATGNLFGISMGLLFATNDLAQLSNFESAWVSDWQTRTVGLWGEIYQLSGTTLTVDWRTGDPAKPYTITINNWHQGDFGISLTQLGLSNALDSGTNADGIHTNIESGSVPVSVYRQQLATIGYGLGEDFASSGFAALAAAGDDDSLMLMGSDAANTLTGGAGGDFLNGRTGNDTLEGGEGSDTYFFNTGDGADTIRDSSGRIVFQDGIDLAAVTRQLVVGASGFKDILVTYGADTIRILGNGADADLGAWTFETTVISQVPMRDYDGPRPPYSTTPSAGRDSLSGDAGANVLAGGAGDDLLSGGKGADTYVFNLGDGKDIIREELITQDRNIIQLGTGIAPTNVLVVQSAGGGDFVLRIGSGGDELTLQNRLITASASLDEVHFADGTVWTMRDLLARSSAPTSGDQTIYGDIFANEIGGGAGNDLLIGKAGEDIYRFNLGDGRDTIRDGGLSTEIDTLVFGPNIQAAAVTVVANGDSIELRVNASDIVVLENAVKGVRFSADAVRFADGTLWSYDDLLAKIGLHGQTITGTSAAETLTGTALADVIDGRGGADQLNGGEGGDTYLFRAGSGNDTITENAGPTATDKVVLEGLNPGDVSFARASSNLVVTILATGETLTVLGHFTGTLNGIEQVIFSGGQAWSRDRIEDAVRNDGVITIRGTNFVDTLTGTSGADRFLGLEGNDTMSGGAGVDRYVIAGADGTDIINDGGSDASEIDIVEFAAGIAPGDVVVSQDAAGEDLILSINGLTTRTILDGRIVSETAGADEVRFSDGTVWSYAVLWEKSVTATAGADRFFGDARANTISGGAGDDALTGRGGDDTLAGGSGNDVLDGGEGNDVLDGGAGNDTLRGGAGNDTYGVDAAGDLVIENAAEGTDTIQTTLASYTLGANVENLTFTGTGAFAGTGNTLANLIVGGSGSDTLNGGSGNDTLDGGAGGDTLIGGLGNDVFIVDSAGDSVVENASEGLDEVRTTLGSYTLGANVENLTGTATTGQILTGNALANTITGGAGNDALDGGDGNDVLDGRGGDDTLTGGLGADTYYVDSIGDVIVEAAVGGSDTVITTLAGYTLITGVENLTYAGTGAFTGTGNSAANVLTGGSGNDVLSGSGGADTLNGGGGNDTLDGGTGNDTLIGGAGNDVYVVDAVGDVVTENAGEGTDEIRTTLAVIAALAANVENLTYTGTAAFAGTGNGLDNVITGSSGNDTLTGDAGNDRLDGGAGNDTLLGGTGDD